MLGTVVNKTTVSFTELPEFTIFLCRLRGREEPVRVQIFHPFLWVLSSPAPQLPLTYKTLSCLSSYFFNLGNPKQPPVPGLPSSRLFILKLSSARQQTTHSLMCFSCLIVPLVPVNREGEAPLHGILGFVYVTAEWLSRHLSRSSHPSFNCPQFPYTSLGFRALHPPFH